MSEPTEARACEPRDAARRKDPRRKPKFVGRLVHLELGVEPETRKHAPSLALYRVSDAVSQQVGIGWSWRSRLPASEPCGRCNRRYQGADYPLNAPRARRCRALVASTPCSGSRLVTMRAATLPQCDGRARWVPLAVNDPRVASAASLAQRRPDRPDLIARAWHVDLTHLGR